MSQFDLAEMERLIEEEKLENQEYLKLKARHDELEAELKTVSEEMMKHGRPFYRGRSRASDYALEYIQGRLESGD